MATLGMLGGLAARQARRTIGPLHRRRHHHALRRGAIDTDTLRRARATWWGDDPRWYPGGTPPRLHNRVAHRIDGEGFLGDLQDALANAQHYVYIIGWSLTPHIPLDQHPGPAVMRTRLLDLLSATAQRVPVRMLLWSGSAAFLPPTKKRVEEVCRTVATEGSGDLQCQLDTSARFTHCHHQKAIVVDGQVAYVGGMDLTTLAGDRWDTSRHPLRAGPNWHDVQVRIEGEAVADVEHNFRQRWTATTGRDDLPHRDPAYDPAWRTPVQIARTIPRHVYPFAPRGEYGIHHAYINALRGAKRFVYLENQYLWSPDIMDALIAAMNREMETSFPRIAIVLPARADSGKWDNDQHIAKLRAVDNGRGMISVYSLYTSGPNAGRHPFTYRPIYLHAKVAIIDDEWLTVGSANLNNRGLVTDSELNAVVRDAALARDLRIDLWAEHLALPREQVAATDPIDLIDRPWHDRAEENARIIARADRPLTSQIHRYNVGHMPGSWLLEEVEALTFEH